MRRCGSWPCAISDAVDDRLPREIQHLARQRSGAGRLGAALATLLDRPGSLKEMLKLSQDALAASERLAKFLARLISATGPGGA